MKMAKLDGKPISAADAIAYRERTGKKGYIYACLECGTPARIHKDADQEGHFEHEMRVAECSLSHVCR